MSASPDRIAIVMAHMIEAIEAINHALAAERK